MDLSNKIGASDIILSDVSRLFEVDYSNLWDKETGNKQIDYLISDYKFIHLTNEILMTHYNKKKDALVGWKEKISFIMCSYESLENKYPSAKILFDFLLAIFEDKEILPDQFARYVYSMDENKDLLSNYLSNEQNVFYDIYGPYLDGISLEEVHNLRKGELNNIFKKRRTDSNQIVKQLADSYKKDQLKNQIITLWKDKTSSKNPKDWSYIHKTPIILLVDNKEFDEAKKAFDVLNRQVAIDKELKDTMEFLNKTSLFEKINSKEEINTAFSKLLQGYDQFLNLDKVRDKLSLLTIEPFDWYGNPTVSAEIERMAQAEYDAGGSDKIVKKIENMTSEEAKKYLIDMVRNNIKLGAEIINKEEWFTWLLIILLLFFNRRITSLILLLLAMKNTTQYY
ncbi:hypothetical protein EI71_00746 [Anaeroplasma bactoclasticum]|uniref:Uncharacterized protein n=1 Tax=Anaeroplasma bactoclasticum TaxID=2088 RepID=A0A397RUU6_9MOLU|nr:hypothetical protein EI71_00746 [Anaeroplasma bactoclasticum]